MDKEFIILTFIIRKEGRYWVSECREFNVSSFGLDEKEAFNNLFEATEVYISTLVDLGEKYTVLKEKNVQIFDYEPTNLVIKRASFTAGHIIRPTPMKIPDGYDNVSP